MLWLRASVALTGSDDCLSLTGGLTDWLTGSDDCHSAGSQVCDFLNFMVRALSSYYGPKGVRILPNSDGTQGGGAGMYPRIFFCQALKQVIDNGLKLLMIEPLEKM